jgi:hypothetical protein
MNSAIVTGRFARLRRPNAFAGSGGDQLAIMSCYALREGLLPVGTQRPGRAGDRVADVLRDTCQRDCSSAARARLGWRRSGLAKPIDCGYDRAP